MISDYPNPSGIKRRAHAFNQLTQQNYVKRNKYTERCHRIKDLFHSYVSKTICMFLYIFQFVFFKASIGLPVYLQTHFFFRGISGSNTGVYTADQSDILSYNDVLLRHFKKETNLDTFLLNYELLL